MKSNEMPEPVRVIGRVVGPYEADIRQSLRNLDSHLLRREAFRLKIGLRETMDGLSLVVPVETRPSLMRPHKPIGDVERVIAERDLHRVSRYERRRLHVDERKVGSQDGAWPWWDGKPFHASTAGR
jgi:hypothetical protein